MLRKVDSSTMRMRRPSTVMIRSWAKVDRVRMALAVVMFDRLARSYQHAQGLGQSAADVFLGKGDHLGVATAQMLG